jgi:hypothetical protein
MHSTSAEKKTAQVVLISQSALLSSNVTIMTYFSTNPPFSHPILTSLIPKYPISSLCQQLKSKNGCELT